MMTEDQENRMRACALKCQELADACGQLARHDPGESRASKAIWALAEIHGQIQRAKDGELLDWEDTLDLCEIVLDIQERIILTRQAELRAARQ